MRYPASIEKLQRLLQKLPGVGKRTAERFAFDFVLEWKPEEVRDIINLLSDVKSNIIKCVQCGALTENGRCLFCTDAARRSDVLCVVATAREVFHIENTREFRGLYHVLGTLLSPLDGRGEELLQLDKLLRRLHAAEVREVIIALDSTLEGDTTALFLKEQLEKYPIKVSRLAFGIPVGSSLEYVDGGTLARAFIGRVSYSPTTASQG